MELLKQLLLPYWPVIWKILLCCLVVIAAIALDLWAGIRKAREAGITVVHTYGLDRTLDKIRKRFNLILSFTIIDIVLIACGVHEEIPYATAIITIIFCLVEAKSIFEKDKDKGRYIEAAKTAAEMWKGINKDELAEAILKKIKEKQDEEKEEER
jgi:hypothetical protein